MATLKTPKEFIVLDFETTGLDPSSCEIIEIGAIRCNSRFEQLARYETLVKGHKVPAKITEITGITQSHADAGKPPAQATQELLNFIGKLDIYAHNADFERRFLSEAARKYLNARVNNHFSCTIAAAKSRWPGLHSYKLQALAEMAGLDHVAHRAIGDVTATIEIMRAMARPQQKIPAQMSPKSRLTTTQWLVAGAFALLVYSLVWPKQQTPEKPPEPQKTPEEIEADRKIYAAQDAARRLKSLAKTPDSVQFRAALMMPDGTTCYTLTAKNSFNGTASETAVLTADGQLKTGSQARKAYKSKCESKTGRDITATVNRAI